MNAFNRFLDRVETKHALFGQDIDSITARMKISFKSIILFATGNVELENAFINDEVSFEEAASKIKQIVKMNFSKR